MFTPRERDGLRAALTAAALLTEAHHTDTARVTRLTPLLRELAAP